MAPKQKSKFLTVVDKGRRFFGNRYTESLPGDLHHDSATNPLTSPSTTSQKKFKKSNDARHDMSVLALTYILQGNPSFRKTIHLIIGLNQVNDHDDSGKLSDVLAVSAAFTVQLASFYEEDSSKVLTPDPITAFLTTMQDIDAMVRAGSGTGDDMNDMMKDSIKQIKNTHPALDNRDRNIVGDHGLSGILDTMIGTTNTILNIFKEASNAIPVPFVQPLVAGVASLLTAVQQTRSNHGDMRQIAAVGEEFVVMLAETCAGSGITPSPSFRQALDRFEKKLRDIAQQCNDLGRRNVFWRFLQQGVDQNSLLGIRQGLQNAIAEFQTNAQLLQHLDLQSLGQVINRNRDEEAWNALPKLSLSDVGRRDEYFPESRNDDIQVIANWLETPDHVAFWMYGGAGLGKSTLAHKIVDLLQASGRLATFAFLRHGSSHDVATVIRSMARELGVLHPEAIPQVATAARTCSGHLSLHKYIESYLIKPIQSLSYPHPLVIVIDALDEWEKDCYEAFLEGLEYIPKSSVKFLLTSRPNHSIELSLLNVAVHKYQLPPVSQAITVAYFNHHFAKMEMRKPSPIIVSNLAHLADGLLIWAAMVCSFLLYDMRADAPHKLLDQILSSTKQITHQRQLSSLYHDALTQLFPDNKEQQNFNRVFGPMTVLLESLPLHDFADLLGMSHTQVSGVQHRLTALQTRGTFDKKIIPPASERFHSSFIEFTMNLKAEVSNPLIPCLIDPQMAHQSMAEGCLSYLNSFLPLFRGRHSDLHGLKLYTVKFWPLHMANSNDCLTPLPPKLNSLLLELPENHLRQWGSWFLAIRLPASSQDWDQVLGPINKDGFYCSLAGFLEDNIMTDTTLASSRTFCLEIAIRSQPKLLKAWEDLGDSYITQFENTGILDLLNHAIIVYHHALELSPKDGSQCTCMFGLASALWQRFRRTGSMDDLNEAILMDRETLSLRPTSHPDRSSSLTNLGLRLCDRFRKTQSMADLEEATSMHRESLSLCPKPHPYYSTSLNNLGVVLMELFAMTGSMNDLEEAIAIHRESLSLRPTPHPRRSFSLNNLANALYHHFEKTGSMTDLQEVILLHRESLSLCPTSHPYHSNSLHNLANALQKHFGKTGVMTDLKEAILLYRESLSFRPTPHPKRFKSLDCLARALCVRFRETGSKTDLEEAISMLREALSIAPTATHPHRLLANLESLLETQFNEMK